MTLAELNTGQMAIVSEIRVGRHGQGLSNRLEAMGMITNKLVTVLRKAGLGGPLHVRIGLTTEVAIRRAEAKMVGIQLLDVAE
jgi:ferrous iron transport protein A